MLGPLLQVSVARSGDTATVRIEGELDFGTAPQLEGALAELLDGQPVPRRLVVDAEELSFADVSGLRPLALIRRRLPAGAVQLRNPQPNVARVIRLLDLADEFGLGG